jgi:hypothetical protein
LDELRALAAQLVQVAGLSLGHNIQLGTQHGQHGQQLARAEFSRSAALKSRQGFGRHTRLGRYIALLQTQQLATGGDGFTEFLERLQLMFASSFLYQARLLT